MSRTGQISSDTEGKAQNIVESLGVMGRSAPASFFAILALLLIAGGAIYTMWTDHSASNERYNQLHVLLRDIVTKQQEANAKLTDAYLEDRPGKMSAEDRVEFIAGFTALTELVKQIDTDAKIKAKQADRHEQLLERMLQILEKRERREQPQSFWYKNDRWSV